MSGSLRLRHPRDCAAGEAGQKSRGASATPGRASRRTGVNPFDRDVHLEPVELLAGPRRHGAVRLARMAQQGQAIHNPRTGQRMTFVELTDDLLRIETVNPPTAEPEPLHVHPRQESGTEVLSGSLVFEIGGECRRVSAGESVSIPPRTPHRFYNDGDADARHMQFFRPALDIASLFETAFALEQQGKVGADGMPSLLQLAVMVPEFGDELRPVSPPWPLLRAVSAILAPIARRRGYRARLDLP